MKVLLFTHIYPPAIDGGSRIIAKIGEYLHRHGHQTLVLTSDCLSTDDFVVPHTPTLPSSSEIIRLPVYKHLRQPLKLLGLKGPIFKILPLITAFIQINRFKPNYIIAGPLPTSIILYAYFLHLFTPSKLVIIPCFHPTDPDFTRQILLSVLRLSDLICTLTNYENKLLSRYSAKIFTLFAGVDKDFLINPAKVNFPKNPHILFLGNFASHKGIDLLLNSFSDLKSQFPHLRLTIAGQKTLSFQHLTNKDKNITIIDSGYNTKKLKQLIDNCSLVVLPSRHESFGLVLIETMARGKPVVVSNLPATSELIHQTQGGLTFDLSRPSSLTSIIQSLLSQPTQLKKMGAQGFAYVKSHLTWDRIGDSLCQKLSALP